MMGAESMRRSASCLPATAQDHEACAAMSEDCLLEGEKLQKNLLSGTLSGALPSARGPYSARSLGFSPSRRFSCDCGRPPNRALPLAVGSKNAPRAGPQSSLSSSARWNSGARLGPLFRSGGPEAALRATGLGGRRRRSAAYFSASPAPGHPKPPTRESPTDGGGVSHRAADQDRQGGQRCRFRTNETSITSRPSTVMRRALIHAIVSPRSMLQLLTLTAELGQTLHRNV